MVAYKAVLEKDIMLNSITISQSSVPSEYMGNVNLSFKLLLWPGNRKMKTFQIPIRGFIKLSKIKIKTTCDSYIDKSCRCLNIKETEY